MHSSFVFLLLLAAGISNAFRIKTIKQGGTYFYRSCLEDEFDTLWPDYVDNNAYYVCTAAGFAERKLCPDRLAFSFQQQVCVWKWEWENPPSLAEIAPIKKIVRSGENSKTKSCMVCWYPACATEEDLKVLWPNYDDITLFSQCTSFGNYVSQTCPKGTVFNFQAQVCGWPHQWINLPKDPSSLVFPKPEIVLEVPNDINLIVEETHERPSINLEDVTTAKTETLSIQSPNIEATQSTTVRPVFSTVKVLTTSEKFAKRFSQQNVNTTRI